MTTQTLEIVDGIEHLDHEVMCVSKLHQDGARPPAELFIDQHGCRDYLFCAACEAHDRRVIEDALANGADVFCIRCKQQFWAYGNLYTRVMPL
ncbi:hypothetical protein [Nocardia xishanensis]|uniref:hypothetical protein n=1 Tax=Nocardia xishanensis TaxID=238964 RepID=UPI000831FEB6|nr:hypothetical protein [Nocardia xishanensis]